MVTLQRLSYHGDLPHFEFAWLRKVVIAQRSLLVAHSQCGGASWTDITGEAGPPPDVPREAGEGDDRLLSPPPCSHGLESHSVPFQRGPTQDSNEYVTCPRPPRILAPAVTGTLVFQVSGHFWWLPRLGTPSYRASPDPCPVSHTRGLLCKCQADG